MKRARPANRGIVQRDASVVERWLIEKIGDPFRSSAPDQRRDCVDDQSKAILGFLDFVKSFLQRLLGEVLLGDINVRTNQLEHFTVFTDERMSHRMYVSCRTVRKIYPKIDFKVRFLSHRLPRHFDNQVPVFGENTILEGLR